VRRRVTGARSPLPHRGNTWYVYGGLVEPEDAAELTLNDLWAIDLAKLDGWVCLHEGEKPEVALVREDESEESSEQDDADESSDSEQEQDVDDDLDEDDDEERAASSTNFTNFSAGTTATAATKKGNAPVELS